MATKGNGILCLQSLKNTLEAVTLLNTDGDNRFGMNAKKNYKNSAVLANENSQTGSKCIRAQCSL